MTEDQTTDVYRLLPIESDGWPGILVTEPVEGEPAGGMRRILGPVPGVVLTYADGQPAPFEAIALHLGARYYTEALEASDSALRQHRIACFQAGEILYHHAMLAGDAQAASNLGYLYAYDYCDGDYWQDDRESRDLSPGGIERLAYECFERGALGGIPQASYKLGDMVRDGRGCEADLTHAAELYLRGYQEGTASKDPQVWGSSALRLAGMHELGEGVSQSFEEALQWYERAAAGLDIAVNQGDWLYRKSLKRALDGEARMRQELDGTY